MSEYSPSEEERLARLRERIGTSAKAIRRRQIFDEHVRSDLGRPHDVEEFRTSFRDLTKKLRIADSFNSTYVTPHESPTLHVFGPSNYDFGAGHTDDPPGVDIEVKWDLNTGKLVAAESRTVADALAFAIVGANFTPAADCHLSVRPYMNWSGFDALQHFDADPDLGRQAWATAIGQAGIYIISSTPSGQLWNEDANFWKNLWYRSEPNPSGTRSYEGTESSSSGLEVVIYAEAGRLYEIQVGIRAYVSVSSTFAVTAGASAEVSAKVPFFVVEEILD